MSNQRSTTKFTSNLYAPPPPSSERPDITDIRYFIEGYVLHHKSRRHSPHTIEFYTDRLGRLAWFLEHEGYPTTLPDISPSHLRAFMVYLSEQEEGRWDSPNHQANRPLMQSSIHSYAKAMRAFFIWVTREARLPTIPFGQYTFADVLPTHAFWLYVERLLLNRPNVMGGHSCGGPREPCDGQNRPYFRPNNPLTRGQTSKIVANTFFPDCQTPNRR